MVRPHERRGLATTASSPARAASGAGSRGLRIGGRSLQTVDVASRATSGTHNPRRPPSLHPQENAQCGSHIRAQLHCTPDSAEIKCATRRPSPAGGGLRCVALSVEYDKIHCHGSMRASASPCDSLIWGDSPGFLGLFQLHLSSMVSADLENSHGACLFRSDQSSKSRSLPFTPPVTQPTCAGDSRALAQPCDVHTE